MPALMSRVELGTAVIPAAPDPAVAALQYHEYEY
jgi:hypothetical protein